MVAITYGVARAAIAAAKTNTARKGLFTRALEALMESRLRAAQREIAMHRHLIADWDHSNVAVKQDELPFGR